MLCFRVNILLLTLVVIVFCLFPLIALCFYNGDSSSSNDGYNSNHHYSSSNSSRKSVNPPPSSPTSSSSFTSSFLSALSMILISELGDKTFIIAAIMAMKHSQVLVFISSALALVLMTILSVLFGALLPSILSKQLTTIIAGSLFVVFGAKMIYEAATDQVSSTKDEIEEVSVELISSSSSSSSLSRRTSENSTVFSSASGNVAISASNEELSSEEQQQQLRNNIHHHSNSNKSLFDRIICSYPIFIQGFTITFLAEWGDRSQISTIALAAAQNPFAVTLGAIIGHITCTLIAVLGGRMLACKISTRKGKCKQEYFINVCLYIVTMVGGCLFILFAIISFIEVLINF